MVNAKKTTELMMTKMNIADDRNKTFPWIHFDWALPLSVSSAMTMQAYHTFTNHNQSNRLLIRIFKDRLGGSS